MLYPAHFDNKIGFDKIREKTKSHCCSMLGKQKADEISFISDYEILKKLLTEVDECKHICQFESGFPLDDFYDLTECLSKLSIAGTFPEQEELFHLKYSLKMAVDICSFFKARRSTGKYARLSQRADVINIPPFVIQSINRIIDDKGEILDNASPDLLHIRKELARKRKDAGLVIQKIMHKAKESGIIEKDVEVAMRNNRPVIPVGATHKRKIQGFIHGESATGKTYFIEPTEVFETYNDIAELEYAETREIVKILTQFADSIREYLPQLHPVYDFLAVIDVTRAKARLAVSMNAVMPNLVNTPEIHWHDAVHPVLFLLFKESGKSVVAQDISLNATQRVLIISGPNAGGKSVCLQTAGLLQYMLQCGFLIPVNPDSTTGIFRNIFIDIGDEQSIENDLSTYSSHLIHMKHFLTHADNNTLFMIDEFGAGTEPTIGGAIAESVLKALLEKKALGIITTHYANLKYFGSSTDHIVNGAMLYDSNTMSPLFKLETGIPGSSFAFEIARKIGLPENIINEAAERAGKDHVTFDKLITEISSHQLIWKEKQAQAEKEQKETEAILKKYAEEITQIKQLRKDILKEAKDKAQTILKDINKQVEQAIRDIKAANASKEAIHTAHTTIAALKKTAHDALDGNLRPGEILHDKTQELHAFMQPEEEQKDAEIIFTKGDAVKITGQDSIGEIIDCTKNSCLVAFGQMITTVHPDKLEKVIGNETTHHAKRVSGFGIDMLQRSVTFKSDIDIRGKRAEEALQIISALIDEALMVGSSHLRILHGKGNGILRKVIQQYLKDHEAVKSFSDERVELGGTGITNVVLK